METPEGLNLFGQQMLGRSAPKWREGMSKSEKQSFAQWYLTLLKPWGCEGQVQSPDKFTYAIFEDFISELITSKTMKDKATLTTIRQLSGLPEKQITKHFKNKNGTRVKINGMKKYGNQFREFINSLQLTFTSYWLHISLFTLFIAYVVKYYM